MRYNVRMPQDPQTPPLTDHDALQNALASVSGEARCKGCGYQLRGLTEPRCPECGLRFSPSDPWSYDIPGRRRPTRRKDLTPDQALLICSGLGAGLFLLNRLAVPEASALFVIPGLSCGLMAIIYVLRLRFDRSFAAACNPKRAKTGRRLLLLMFLLLFHYGACRCDHARAVAFLNIGFAYSPSHGPCHNPPFAPNGTHVHLAGHWWLAKMDRF